MPNKNLKSALPLTLCQSVPLCPIHSVSCWFLQVGDNSKVESALYLPNQKWCGASLSIFSFFKLEV